MTIFQSLQFVTTLASGIFTGALLTEAFVLVPFWRKMDAADFLSRHASMGPSLFRFFAPLTVAGSMLPPLTWLLATVTHSPTQTYWAISGLIGLAMLAIYFAYFDKANASFKDASIEESALANELARWAFWHNFRTGLAVIGFSTALLALT